MKTSRAAKCFKTNSEKTDLAKASTLSVHGLFFLRFLKSIGWFGFSYGFLVVLNLFHQCFILICTNIHSIKYCIMKDLPESVGNLWQRPLSPSRVQKKKTNKKTNLGLKYLY
jgi:hypothetical protein